MPASCGWLRAAMSAPWIVPDWPLPANVHARVTTRAMRGHSQPPFDRCNLGDRCGDDAAAVSRNRAGLVDELGLPAAPRWLQQVHGIDVFDADDETRSAAEPQADAALTRAPGVVLAVLTADCVPLLFACRDGSAVAVAHAGWRGLAAGVIEATCARLSGSADALSAWLGPAIGAASYEVGEDVRAAFVDTDRAAAGAFVPTRPGHWNCDLVALARRRLAAIGVRHVHGGGFDTRTDARFYSHRREAPTGRFASLVWRD